MKKPLIIERFSFYDSFHLEMVWSLGSKKARMPNIGKKATPIMVGVKPKASMNEPRATDPIAPIPNASPTVKPDIVPIFPGNSSWA